MNITSFLANKCLEFLLSASAEMGNMPHGSDLSRRTPGSPGVSRSFPLPPWVRDTQLFQQECDGCGNCIVNCENRILFLDDKGYPRLDFSLDACSFCGKCAESCPKGCFSDRANPPWALMAFITPSCLSHHNVVCGTCAEHCAEHAIVMPNANGRLSTPQILPEKCTGCGACFSPCPVRAIKISRRQEREK